MSSHEHLRINANDLIEALDTRMDELFWAIDLESGEVKLSGEFVDEDESEEEEEAWEDPDRFLVVQAMESHEAFQIMEDFVEEVPEGEGCRALARALRLPKPFRSFKETLSDFPDLRERWFKFHHGKMLEYAQDWLDDRLPGARLAL